MFPWLVVHTSPQRTLGYFVLSSQISHTFSPSLSRANDLLLWGMCSPFHFKSIPSLAYILHSLPFGPPKRCAPAMPSPFLMKGVLFFFILFLFCFFCLIKMLWIPLHSITVLFLCLSLQENVSEELALLTVSSYFCSLSISQTWLPLTLNTM